MKQSRKAFLRKHSLSLAALGVVIFLIALYCRSNPATHIGSFFGNAIADWTGVLVTVVMTKHLYEKGSTESKQPQGKVPSALVEFLREHSLTMVLLITGIGWVVAFRALDPGSRWGTGGWEHRFGVDTNPRAGPDDQTLDGGRIEGILRVGAGGRTVGKSGCFSRRKKRLAHAVRPEHLTPTFSCGSCPTRPRDRPDG